MQDRLQDCVGCLLISELARFTVTAVDEISRISRRNRREEEKEMVRNTAQPIIIDEPQFPAVAEFNLGPMRILNCKHVKDGKLGHYVLSVLAGGSIIQIVASGGGQTARVMRDGTELGKPGSPEEPENPGDPENSTEP